MYGPLTKNWRLPKKKMSLNDNTVNYTVIIIYLLYFLVLLISTQVLLLVPEEHAMWVVLLKHSSN